MTLKERTSKIIEFLNEGIHERVETIAVSFLAALSDQNIFLFGPPGTAKSLIARRISRAFETNSYFEYLMHRFSTPEDVFGPVSITELKKDNLLRRTEGFLPQSDFAFLDEIWKSSPSILNTLLTIINEKVFRNGTEVENAPLKALIAASNETPPPGQGLEAMYDRFLVRLNITPMEDVPSFNALLNSKPAPPDIQVPGNLIIKHAEWENWCERIHEVELSVESLKVIQAIRLAFEEIGDKLDVYVSDRRWQRAAILLKAAAFFNGRDEVNLVDCLLLRHCLWTTKENYHEVIEIVEKAVRDQGFETEFSLDEIDSKKEKLEKEIDKDLLHSKEVYETFPIDKKRYFKCQRERPDSSYNAQKQRLTFYIPIDRMKTRDEFHPIDNNGNELEDILCCFHGQGTCEIKMQDRRYSSYSARWEAVNKYKPKVLFQKGDKKEGVSPRIVRGLQQDIEKMSNEFDAIIEQIQTKRTRFKDELATPFVPDQVAEIAWESVENQLREMRLRRQDCDRLKSKATA